MSTNLTERDKALLFILLGVLVIFVVYMTICKDFDSRTAAAETQLAELTPQLQQLQEYQANLKTYEAKNTKMRDEIGTQMERFPVDIRSEHIINNATTLQDSLGIKVQSVGADPAVLLSSFQLPLKDDATGKYSMQNVYAFSTGENLQCTMSYDQFKSLLDFAYTRQERTAVKSVSVTYNSESGGLSGTVALVKYFVVPEKYVYTKEAIDGVQLGVTNLFGTTSPAARSGGSTSAKSGTTASGTTASGSNSGVTVHTQGSVSEIQPPATDNR